MCIYQINNYYGRLGNNLLQICSTLYKGTTEANLFDFKTHKLLNYKNLTNTVGCACKNIHNHNSQILDYHKLSTLKFYYKHHVSIKGENRSNKYDVGIHIRSGDIFQVIGRSHRLYIQPPFYFYDKIISENVNKKIVIVFENMNNPVIKKLHNKYKSLDNITFQSSNIIDDIYALSNCTQLVFSNGTFCLAPYLESETIESIIAPDYMKNNHWFEFDDNVTYVSLPNYMTNETWSNTNTQRNIMLNYSV